MSVDIESRMRAFFASAPQTVHQIVVLEFSHSAMSQVYFFWREPYAGQVTTEDAVVHDVEPLNIDPTPAGSEGHLDEVFQIKLDTTDVEDRFREELDAIPLYSTELVRCVYREYLSDDLTDVQARAVLQVETISCIVGAATLSAASPRYNVTRTGELYTPRDVPMQREFL